MVTDLAQGWVSPYWQSNWDQEDPAAWIITYVYIVNPGASPAEVTLTWHEVVSGPTDNVSDTRTIDARGIATWEAPQGDYRQGWVSITSDEPVLPWGSIRSGGPNPDALERVMAFGRWDWSGIKPPHFQPL